MKEINIQQLRRNFEKLKKQPQHKSYMETNLLYQIKVMAFEQSLKPQYYSIAALGQFSSGKSTMINALVGESLLIEKSEESTSVITKLRYGNQKQIILEKLDGSKQIVACTHDNLQKYTTRAFSESHNIKEATIEVPLAYLQNDVQLIDTPGSNSLNQELFEKTKFIIEQSIAVVMTIPAGKFTQSEQTFVKQIKQAKQHLFVVLTRKSDVNPKEHSENIKSTEKILSQVLEKKDYTVVLVDSKQAIEAKQTKNQELLQKSGYLEFEEKIADYIASGKYVQDYQAIVQQKYNDLEALYLEIEENETNLKKEQENLYRIQRGRYEASLHEEKETIMKLCLDELQNSLKTNKQKNEIYYEQSIVDIHRNFKNSSEVEYKKIERKIADVGKSSEFKLAVNDVKRQAENIPRVYKQNLDDLSRNLSKLLTENQQLSQSIISDFKQSFQNNLNQIFTMKMTNERLVEIQKQLQVVKVQDLKFRVEADNEILDNYHNQESVIQRNERQKKHTVTNLRACEQDIIRLEQEVQSLESDNQITARRRYRPRPQEYITVTVTKSRFMGFGKKEVSTTEENPEFARWQAYQKETEQLIEEKNRQIYQKNLVILKLTREYSRLQDEIEALDASNRRLGQDGNKKSRQLIMSLTKNITKEKENIFAKFKEQVQKNIDLVNNCLEEYQVEMKSNFENALGEMLDQILRDEMKNYDRKIKQTRSGD